MREPQPTEPPSIIGAVLGSYRITGELSSGGMGTVYLARHELLGRAAAVKLLRPDLTVNAELVTRFFNEAKAATAIRHPGIIEVFDFGYTDDGRAYLVMEFLDGESLAARIAARGRLSEVEAAQIARGIASALTAAHQQGIVHRDLKPDNVFLVPDPDLPGGERPKILDFGIAKLADPAGLPANVRHTATGVLMGTPLYMAPEQARAAGEIDHRADLYSLGCILYELLVGEPPFVAVGAGEIIALQLFAKPTPPSERLAEISPAMEQIVMRLLDKEPDARFQSAAAVSDALAAAFGRLGVRASTPLPVGAPRPSLVLTQRTHAAAGPLIVPTLDELPPPKRNRLPIIAAAITLAIAAGVVMIVLARGGADDAPPPPPPTTKRIAAPVEPPPRDEPGSAVPVQPPQPKEAPKPPRVIVTPPKQPPPCHGKSGSHTINCSPTEDKL